MQKKNHLTHIDQSGSANMVDVSKKPETHRNAEASCTILLSDLSYELLKENKSQKGDVLGVARTAGIMAAKKTSDLIPLCHQLNLSKVDIDFTFSESEKSVLVKSRATTNDRTGVEMESLVAVSITALTIYDMTKAIDHDSLISDIQLVSKKGGK